MKGSEDAVQRKKLVQQQKMEKQRQRAANRGKSSKHQLLPAHGHGYSGAGYNESDGFDSEVAAQHERCKLCACSCPCGAPSIENVKALIDTVQTYPQLLNVEAVLMGFNGALFREASTAANASGRLWMLSAAEKEKAGNYSPPPEESEWLVPSTIKDALATDADACRLLATFLKLGVDEHVVSRAARFGILLLQGNDEKQFSSATAVEAALHMTRAQSLHSSTQSIKRGIRDLLHSCVTNQEGDVAHRNVACARLLRVLQLLCGANDTRAFSNLRFA